MNKNVKGIIALAVVTALSFGVIMGSRALSHNINGNPAEAENGANDVKVVAELDATGAENIEKAVQTEDGYMVTVKAKGYVGEIMLNVFFDETAQTITKVEVLEQNETENLGALIAEAEFLSQFEGVAAPVYLPGMSVEENTEAPAEETQGTDAAVLNDGTYVAKTETADDNGFIEEVTMIVADGKITDVVWDCVKEDGTRKSVLSETGLYVMTEDGPTWKEQAEALADTLVNAQTIEALGMNEQGKTDAVSGVSIYIGGFVALAEQCMTEAAAPKTVALNDGTYVAKTETADDNGFIEEVTMTVADGKITDVVWDCVKEDGTRKSVLSETGLYVMTEDGPTWQEQAEALADTLVKEQTIEALGMNEQGKTDAVSGVSIYIGGFVSLAEQCMAEAAAEVAGEETGANEAEAETAPQNGTQVDAVSGATVSSTAAVKAINEAYHYLQSAK